MSPRVKNKYIVSLKDIKEPIIVHSEALGLNDTKDIMGFFNITKEIPLKDILEISFNGEIFKYNQ